MEIVKALSSSREAWRRSVSPDPRVACKMIKAVVLAGHGIQAAHEPVLERGRVRDGEAHANHAIDLLHNLSDAGDRRGQVDLRLIGQLPHEVGVQELPQQTPGEPVETPAVRCSLHRDLEGFVIGHRPQLGDPIRLGGLGALVGDQPVEEVLVPLGQLRDRAPSRQPARFPWSTLLC